MLDAYHLNVFFLIDAIKKRDKRLESDDEAFKDVWQVVKESVRQLKHDHKRNTTWKNLRAAQIYNTNLSQSQAIDVNNIPLNSNSS